MAGMLNFPGQRGVSSNGRSPITPAGRVVYNMMIDRDEIMVREARLDGTRAAIQVASSPSIWYVNKGNPAVRNRRKRPRRMDQLTPTDIAVVDAANGLGNAGETKAQLNQSIEVYGVIGENKLYDGANMGTIQMGGLQTIRNSGPYDIYPGAWIVVEAPDPHDPKKANFPDLPKEKILFQTVPYEPTRTAPSVKLLRMLLVDDGTVSDRQREDLKRDMAAADDFSREFAAGIKAIAYAGVIAALKSGIVTPTNAGAEEQARQGFDGGSAHNEFKERLGKAFDLASRQPEERFSWHVTDPRTEKEISASQHVMRALLSGADFPPVFIPSSTVSGDSKNYGSLNKKLIAESVQNAMPNMLGAFRQIDFEEKRRIIGRAMSATAPGGDFDIYLGSYIQ